MTKVDSKKGGEQAVFLTFDGNYGGDKYEHWLWSILSGRIAVRKKSHARLGGVRTLASLGKLIAEGYGSNAKFTFRPFGIPVFKRNMIVVFHHYDHTGLPWYGKLVEWVDLIGLKLTAGLLGTRFLVVSKYWANWLQAKKFEVAYLVYNQLDRNEAVAGVEERKYLASKYGLDISSKWVFLGGNQAKKGGMRLVEKFNQGQVSATDYQFIFSGKPATSATANVKILWIDDTDYNGFIRQLHAVIANSQFDEGWCRVLHEGVLGDVPVAGTGRGGMGELLSMAGYSAASTELEMVQFVRDPRRSGRTSDDILDLIQHHNDKVIAALVDRVNS